MSRENYNKIYSEENKESISKNKKEYYENNKFYILDKANKYYQDNKELIKEKRKLYREANKDKIAKQKRLSQQKYLSTIEGKLKHNIRQSIRRSLNGKGYSKPYKSELILGCNVEELKLHLESQFLPWMNWDNKGLYNGDFDFGWDIDHIIPLSSGISEEDIIKLNHFSNLQPLCSKINRDIKKGLLI
jgi:hypothetical protein